MPIYGMLEASIPCASFSCCNFHRLDPASINVPERAHGEASGSSDPEISVEVAVCSRNPINVRAQLFHAELKRFEP